MQDYEIVSIVMGLVTLGIVLFFVAMIFVIHTVIKHKIQTDERIQKKIHELADSAIKEHNLKYKKSSSRT